MGEYNSQRYYWIKLTDRFMTSDTVDFLMEQPNGSKYVVLYQMLCLKSVNNNGELSRKIGEVIIPFNEEKIQRDTKWFDIDTIRIAMQLYKRLGLIYEQEDGVLKISDFDRLIGSQTESAEKKQIQRQNRKQTELIGGQANGQMSTEMGGQVGGQKVENFPPDKEIDKEIDNIYTNAYAYDSKDLLDYNELLQIVKEECPIVFNRHQKKVDSGNLQIASEVMRILEQLQGQYSYERLREIFKKANKIFCVKPSYSSCDIKWVLNNIPRVLSEEENSQPTGNGNRRHSAHERSTEILKNLYNEMREEDDGT